MNDPTTLQLQELQGRLEIEQLQKELKKSFTEHTQLRQAWGHNTMGKDMVEGIKQKAEELKQKIKEVAEITKVLDQQEQELEQDLEHGSWLGLEQPNPEPEPLLPADEVIDPDAVLSTMDFYKMIDRI